MGNSPMSTITKRIRAAGMTLRGWAGKHGFNQQTVANIVNGSGGMVYGLAGIGESGKIVNQLKKDGFWVDPRQKERS